ncbi:MAG: NAD(P)-binding domain-containing protein [Pseudomonadales bacterium]
MKVCVIGAGPSGLTTIKQLLDEGHDVSCFEKNENIGGIWYRHDNDGDQMKVFDNLVLTTSMKLMSFSDFMHKGERTFTDHRGYFRYLERYTETYGLRDHICFNSIVDDISHKEGSWYVTITADGKQIQHIFEAIALCTGPFKMPNRNIPEIQNFTGEIIHSCEYRNNREFYGKKVLVLGLAESGADIVREISNVSSECTLSIRSYSFLVPRLIAGKYATDTLTCRAHHYEMWARATNIPYRLKAFWGNHWFSKAVFFTFITIYGLITYLLNVTLKVFQLCEGEKVLAPKNNMGQALYPSKLDIFTENTQEHLDFINEWNRKSHNGQGSWSQKIIFCKNVSFVPNIINEKICVNDSGIDSIEGRKVYFKNATIKEFDTIVLCTGFINDYSIFGDIKIKDNNVRNLYKHAFHPEYGGRLAVIGLLRPFSGGIPVCSEMQARYFALLCSNKLKLPANLEKLIQQEKEWEETWTSLSPRHYEALPSQIMFLDAIAQEIGCLMPISKLLFKPKLMMKLWFCSFNQSCYRLTGANNMYSQARREIMNEKLPAESNFVILVFSFLSILPYFIHPRNLKFGKKLFG